ncbi:MAG: restriction endonuclease subunit S, partial [Pseudanabaena sp.]
VGKPIISKINCCIHDGFVYFVGLKQNSDFMFYVFNCTNIFAGLGKIGTQLNLNTEIVGGISIPIPPLSEQKAIADYLDKKTAQIDQIIQTINAQIEKLKELRKTLINDVVTGKIKVTGN